MIEKNRREKNPREEKVTFEGLVTEALPNGMFRVQLGKDTIILGYISGKIRSSSIRILMGDRVKIEVSRYDSSKGRIIYRLPHTDSKCMEDSKDSEDLKDSEDSKDQGFLFSSVIIRSSKIQAKRLIFFPKY